MHHAIVADGEDDLARLVRDDGRVRDQQRVVLAAEQLQPAEDAGRQELVLVVDRELVDDLLDEILRVLLEEPRLLHQVEHAGPHVHDRDHKYRLDGLLLRVVLVVVLLLVLDDVPAVLGVAALEELLGRVLLVGDPHRVVLENDRLLLVGRPVYDVVLVLLVDPLDLGEHHIVLENHVEFGEAEVLLDLRHEIEDDHL